MEGAGAGGVAGRSARSPLLVLFGALLVAADAIFERLITEVFGFDLAEVFSHLFLITFFAWITAGVLWAGLMARVPDNFAVPRPEYSRSVS
jgi:hypothetical protein